MASTNGSATKVLLTSNNNTMTYQEEKKMLSEAAEDLQNQLEGIKRDIDALDEKNPTSAAVDQLIEVIDDSLENIIEGYSFETGEFNYELHMEYDNRVELEITDFHNYDGLAQYISEALIDRLQKLKKQ